MEVSGYSEKSREFLSNLDPKKLVELTVDILALQGHTDIKNVDGLGDGCRDIHSKDKEGEKHLTQCKHHRRVDQTITSREIGELPLGMVRLGYEKGLFVTNAKISPQSKREFLDNYPDLQLDFWEGSQIPKRVFGNVILRAIWFEGKSIDQLSYVLTIPAIARDIQKDKPLPIYSLIDNILNQEVTLDDNLQVQLRFREGTLNQSRLDPYRPPKNRTISEGWGWGRCIDIVILGPIPFDKLNFIHHLSAEKLLDYLKGAISPKIKHLAVRVGKPYLSPLSGENVGGQIDLDCKPFTMVSHNLKTYAEREWLLPSVDKGWYPPDRVQTSHANWARWYHPNFDLCLDLNVLSIPSGKMKDSIQMQHAHLIKYWNKSIFALIPRSVFSNFNIYPIPQPSEVRDWYEEQCLCAWKHGNLAPGIKSMPLEPDEDDESGFQNLFDVDPLEVENEFSELKSQLMSIGAKLIDPSKARHMIASLELDPFPNKDLMVYRSIELMYDTSSLPSPIDPDSRRAIITICWILDNNQKVEPTEALYEEIDNFISSESTKWEKSHLVFDNDTLAGSYCVLDLKQVQLFGMEDTDTVLERALNSLIILIEQVEELIKKEFPNLRRATHEFWNKEIGIKFCNGL